MCISHTTCDSKLRSVVQSVQSANLIMTLSNVISEFYRDQHILITGSTGFVGKVLLEKLLRTCPQLGCIYLLIRSKRGMSSDLRLKELLQNQIFDVVRDINPSMFEKVRVVSGDVTKPNLGLCVVDWDLLIDKVNIVLHSAADVRFNESLQDAVLLNTVGTKRIIDLCLEAKQLISFVHVSTAYCISDRRHVEETVYPSLFDPYTIMKCAEMLPAEIFNSLSKKLLGKHPNTYTFTKALAENLVSDSSAQLPVSIVRPSIVTASWKEPIPGWVDNISGITGIMMEIGRGTISSIVCEKQYLMDLIPVDIVANTILASAWFITVQRSNTVRVFNCTSGQINGITWQDFGHLTIKYAIKYPTKYLALYPGFKYRTSRFMHYICHLGLHFFPAIFYDALLVCCKKQPIMLRICQKFAQAAKNGTFFAINQWVFDNDNMTSLVRAVDEASSLKAFNCDLSLNSGFYWDTYVKHYMLGIRQFILKDDFTSLDDAKSKLKKFYWVNKFMQLFIIYILLRFLQLM